MHISAGISVKAGLKHDLLVWLQRLARSPTYRMH